MALWSNKHKIGSTEVHHKCCWYIRKMRNLKNVLNILVPCLPNLLLCQTTYVNTVWIYEAFIYFLPGCFAAKPFFIWETTHFTHPNLTILTRSARSSAHSLWSHLQTSMAYHFTAACCSSCPRLNWRMSGITTSSPGKMVCITLLGGASSPGPVLISTDICPNA